MSAIVVKRGMRDVLKMFVTQKPGQKARRAQAMTAIQRANTVVPNGLKECYEACTPKQRAYVMGIAEGKGKRVAYVEAYSPKAESKKQQSVQAAQIAAVPKVKKLTEAIADHAVNFIAASAEAKRSWIVERLTTEAIEANDSTRVRALELLGKLREVRLFVESHEEISPSVDEVEAKLRAIALRLSGNRSLNQQDTSLGDTIDEPLTLEHSDDDDPLYDDPRALQRDDV
jgi:hypothetical protein